MVHSRPYAVLDKEVGETPLEALTRFKQEHSAYQDVPASYAGRLDPMASGKLLVLLGDECKKQKEYTGLDKEYLVEVLLDVSSDTGDVLGITNLADRISFPSESDIRAALKKEVGSHMQKYPNYSSKTVDGKPLFLHTLEGTIENIQIPEHEEKIYKIRLLDIEEISLEDLKVQVESMLSVAPVSDEPSKALGADFRIKDVRAGWKNVFAHPERTFVVISIAVTCGTGAYMRSLAGRIGKSLGTQALALSIHRTKIGKYSRLGFFTRLFR